MSVLFHRPGAFATLGVFVHFVFLYSIFDIYFKSPIIRDLQPTSSPLPPPAKRLVLFLADGLRADRFFELDNDGKARAPYLRSIIEERGRWGVSHTRVPTESRVGHVALIGGIYEDVSAVTRGWKDNPVDFDNVFNRSRATFAFGAADIINVFTKGERGNRVFATKYGLEEVDFADKTAYRLDTWTFNKFSAFLREAETNVTLEKMLNEDRIVFFLHLLGIDTNGHAFNPDSKEYLDNIALVDENIDKIVDQIERFFGYDGRTAYVFTSDHGMTDWGTHGSGTAAETETPLVVWGAGVAQPVPSGKDHYQDGYSEAWNLSKYQRDDVHQADICPLMATLIGIPLPVNSVGLLPISYLGGDWEFKAVSLLTNAHQLLAQFDRSRQRVMQTTFLFREFPDMTRRRQDDLVEIIEVLLKQQRFKEACSVIGKFAALALNGLEFYLKFGRWSIKLAILFGFAGWIALSMLYIMRRYSTMALRSKTIELGRRNAVDERKVSVRSRFAGFVMIFLTSVVLFVQRAPVMYYAYYLTPIVLWSIVAQQQELLRKIGYYMRRWDFRFYIGAKLFLAVVALELLIFSFFYRQTLTFGMLFMAVWIHWRDCSGFLKVIWSISCCFLAVFPSLPVVGQQHSYALVITSGCFAVMIFIVFAKRLTQSSASNVVVIAQVTVGMLCVILVAITSSYVAAKDKVPAIVQTVSWFVLLSTPVVSLCSPPLLGHRLIGVSMSFFAPFLLLSVFYESLFLLCLFIILGLWLYVEHVISGQEFDPNFDFTASRRSSKQAGYSSFEISFEHSRRVYFFLFFTVLAFFGTGNIASINSFSISSCYCFVTAFQPFTMAFLLFIKVTLPLLVVACYFRALVSLLDLPQMALLLVAFVMSDFMALHFFMWVRDSGSWLDIGTSISHYILSMSIAILLCVTHSVAWFFTTCSLDDKIANFVQRCRGRSHLS